jgi:hypothetical protein
MAAAAPVAGGLAEGRIMFRQVVTKLEQACLLEIQM